MKLLTLFLIVLTTFSSHANTTRRASQSEVKSFCRSIDKQLQNEAADMALDLKGCNKTRMNILPLYSTGGIVEKIVGVVPFNSPNGKFTMKCEGTVLNQKVTFRKCN